MTIDDSWLRGIPIYRSTPIHPCDICVGLENWGQSDRQALTLCQPHLDYLKEEIEKINAERNPLSGIHSQ